VTSTSGSAPPRRPATFVPSSSVAHGAPDLVGALGLILALPFGVVVRRRSGGVDAINPAAIEALGGIECDGPGDLTLTLIRRGCDDDATLNVYVLSAGTEPLAKLVAKPLEFVLDSSPDLEFLVLMPLSPRALLELRQRTGASRRAKGREFTARNLLACSARRLRRRRREGVALEITGSRPRDCDRTVIVDEIAFAEALLSAAEVLLGNGATGILGLRAALSRHRLWVELDGSRLVGAVTPDLTDRGFTRGLRGFLDRHRATFEVHDDDRGRLVRITIPLERRR
jgi:hypothetical protein